MELASQVRIASAKDDRLSRDLDGRDAAHCSNGLTAERFREATAEERAAYRKWLRGIVFFYCMLVFVSGVAMATYSGGRTQLTDLSARHTASRAN